MPKFRLDDRRIKSIGWSPNELMPSNYDAVEVGSEGVTAIDSIEQALGDYSIVWLQVWCDDEIVARYNARNVDSILYYRDDENEA